MSCGNSWGKVESEASQFETHHDKASPSSLEGSCRGCMIRLGKIASRLGRNLDLQIPSGELPELNAIESHFEGL